MTRQQLIDSLGWVRPEAYDATVFAILNVLGRENDQVVQEIATLREEIRQLREDVAAARVGGGTLG